MPSTFSMHVSPHQWSGRLGPHRLVLSWDAGRLGIAPQRRICHLSVPKGRGPHNSQRVWCGEQRVGGQHHHRNSKAVPQFLGGNGLSSCNRRGCKWVGSWDGDGEVGWQLRRAGWAGAQHEARPLRHADP